MAYAGPGPPASPALSPEGFEWTTWHADPSVILGLAALGGAYLTATLWGRRSGLGIAGGRIAAFTAALAVLFGALTGPIHDLSDYYLFSAHMIQHMLLIFAMPPLLLYGTPAWMLRPLLGVTWLRRLAWRATRPAATFAIFNVVLVAWHLPPLYNLAMERHPVHIV